MGRGEQRRDRLYPDEFFLVNRVEAQFTALRYFALDGTDHQGSGVFRECPYLP
jgi:hypothetical protein